jgi:hypothetical protein
VPTLPTPDHLAGHPGQPEPAEQVLAVRRQGARVVADQGPEHAVVRVSREFLYRDDQRRVGDDLALAVDHPGQLGHRLGAVPGPDLGRHRLGLLEHALLQPQLEAGDGVLHV